MSTDATWILRFPDPHVGFRVAVKDLLDIVGTPTTAGCKAVERVAKPASADAACLAGLRAAVNAGTASIVGKTNLHELAFGADGINPAYGTPVNPLDATRIPGGSSSGSAVAVANNEADMGIGSDTGGSIRIPAACCGIVGLKTTWDRVPVGGCWALAPFLDTIGPLARTVADTITGMDLLEPGFAAEVTAAATMLNRRIGRIVNHWVDIDPAVDAAVDALLARYASEAGVEIVDVEVPGWEAAHAAGLTVLLGEAWLSDGHLLAGGGDTGVSDEVTARLRAGEQVAPSALDAARAQRAVFVEELRAIFATNSLDALAIPTLPTPTPAIGDIANSAVTALTRLANISGSPALSVPAPIPGELPASLQLIGRPGDDAILCALAALLP